MGKFFQFAHLLQCCYLYCHSGHEVAKLLFYSMVAVCAVAAGLHAVLSRMQFTNIDEHNCARVKISALC